MALHVVHKLVGLEQKGEHLIARFENGATVLSRSSGRRRGIRSRVRVLVFGPAKPRFTRFASLWARSGPASASRKNRGLELPSHSGSDRNAHVVRLLSSGVGMINVVCVVEHG